MGEIIDINDYRDEISKYEIDEFEELITKYKKTADTEDFIKLKFKYNLKRAFYESIIYEEKDPKWKKNLGMGFWIVQVEYKNSELIKDFMAESMLNEIYEKIDDLEEYLHNRFKNKDRLLNIGVKDYIINSVYGYDECLSGYLTKYNYLLKTYESKINRIINRWDEYDDELKRRSTDPDTIMSMVVDFIDFHEDCDFEPHDMALYLKYKLGIDIMDVYKQPETYFDYDENGNIVDTIVIDDSLEDDDFFESEEYYNSIFNDLDFKEQKMLSDFNIIIRNYMRGEKMPDSYDYQAYLKEEREKIKTKKINND
ncbi:MAG: hypothetical protein IJF92_02200 [Bacilli bacterium]|nr:hypothetical protein [Bacilli bacterium]